MQQLLIGSKMGDIETSTQVSTGLTLREWDWDALTPMLKNIAAEKLNSLCDEAGKDVINNTFMLQARQVALVALLKERSRADGGKGQVTMAEMRSIQGKLSSLTKLAAQSLLPQITTSKDTLVSNDAKLPRDKLVSCFQLANDEGCDWNLEEPKGKYANKLDSKIGANLSKGLVKLKTPLGAWKHVYSSLIFLCSILMLVIIFGIVSGSSIEDAQNQLS